MMWPGQAILLCSEGRLPFRYQLSSAHRMARDIEAGIIWVNCFDHGDMTQPWGGYKQSGNGRDKCFEAIVAHAQSKSVRVHPGES